MNALEFFGAHFWPIFGTLIVAFFILLYFMSKGIPTYRRVISFVGFAAVISLAVFVGPVWNGMTPRENGDLPVALKSPLGPPMIMECVNRFYYNYSGKYNTIITIIPRDIWGRSQTLEVSTCHLRVVIP